MASPPGAESRADPGEQEAAVVAALQAELGACRAQLERARRRLRRTQRLYRRERESSGALRRQVEELTKEIHNRKEKDTSSVEVQTEDCAAWSQADYYYYENYYSHTDTQDCVSELGVKHSHGNEGTEHNSTEESDAGVNIPLRKDSTKAIEGGEEENFIQNSQETEETSVPEGSLAESLRAAAEAAVSQTGFIYDENTGLYYDHSTGFYYNSENQLYYDPATGIYYYCDVESGRYQFHSRVDLQSYQASGTKHTKDKKGKKKRKEAEWLAADEYKDLDTEEQKTSNSLNCFSTTDQVSSTEEDESLNVRKKTKMDKNPLNSLTAKESISADGINSHSQKSTPDAAAYTDDSRTADTESEPEEGEITDSECETYSGEELTSEETGDSEYSENEDEEKIWPPCIRVIVIRSPVLQTGSLYIITAVKPATIGREKDVGHTLQIPEVGVSKFHAEVYFDHDLQNYVLVDQGSQNGTVVNGNQILQPKTKGDPYILEHGDEVKIGETVLSFHIHPGGDTCDGCEPGQVRAHLRLDKKKESSVCPALSKEERELVRRKALKQIRVKYGLQNTEYEDNKAVKNPKYKDRAGKRRETVGSEGTFQRDDSSASVHIEISNSNKGHKMLEKMGWKKGEGLGKDGGGMKDPIQLELHQKHAGLGTRRPASIEDVQLVQSKNKKNWDKARERFAENFQDPKSQRDTAKSTLWVRGTVD
ncbi:angiogenic factor with G patch and FHA domains 1 [Vidua macroura]|uniref:angiogenic factor with G patch and FHA domains 1 n=1 Tax=Vidua macroura TaxID=187451 RepID=UPI0023A84CA4|nr:angiogenic factor with G patch and FHA domains 1 [Vidua macroura]XP_053858540.1 angiogenic factor with G patch and FHA domains 1 [Vidua macroura]XP_053858541.1 angiogenic factor with G patch and FHA domains 1 [Vidua macroura]